MLTRSLTQPLTSPLARGVGEGGVSAWSAVINRQLLATSPYSTLMQRGRAGTKTNVLVLGDSIALGFGSNATTNLMRMNGLGPLIASRLTTAGITSKAQGIFGNGRQHATPAATTYDSRFVDAAGQGIQSIGGSSFLFSSVSHTLSFTPSESVDTFEIYQYRFGGGGLVSYSVDGATAVNMSFNATAGLNTVTVSGLSAGTHTLTLAYVSGSGGYILGMSAYNSATNGLQFINGAVNGGITGDFTPNTNPYDALKVGVAFAPAATMLILGANHWNTAASVSTFTSELQTLITAYAALGPVILASDPASNPATHASFATQQPYVAAMRQLAITNGLLMFDLWTHFGGTKSDFGVNWLADGIHPSPTGYGVAADLIASALATA